MTRLRSRRGQAAVEGLLAIPVLMVIFMIGFELWGIAWDAQYVNIKSRYNVVAYEDQRFLASQNCQTKTMQSSLVFPAKQLPLIGTVQQDLTISNTATVVCDAP